MTPSECVTQRHQIMPNGESFSVIVDGHIAVDGFPNFYEASAWVMEYLIRRRIRETQTRDQMQPADAAMLDVQRPH